MNSIVESVDEAICVIRPDFQIVKANQNLHRLLRRKPADTERIVEVLRGLNGKEGIIQRAFGGAEVTDCRRMIPLGRRRIPVKLTTRVLRLEEPECRNVMVCLKNESSDYRNRVQRKKLRLQATIAELKALRAQINPHFLFNSLNTIAQLVDIDKERAVDTLSLLADLFRYVMISTKKERVRVEEELQYIGKYLEMLTLRFGESLEVRYEVDESILDREIPPMLIQPLVENAIKYGGDAQGKIAVGITIVPEDGHLRFRVADNGHSLLDVSAVLETSSTGIQNINNRLMTLYNQQLEFARNAPQGLAVGFRIPLGG